MKNINNTLKNKINNIKGASSSQIAVASIFAVALSASISLGVVNRQKSSALVERMCNWGAIYSVPTNGGCGALTPGELIADLRTNQPGDIQAIAQNYAGGFGITPAQYDDVAARTKNGVWYKDGSRVVVDGQTVITNAWTMGRGAGSSWTTPFVIPGVGTYQRAPRTIYKDDALSVLVYFDRQGVARYANMTACGNPVAGDQVVPYATCKALNAEQATPEVNPNVYKFTTNAEAGNNANISRLVYTFSDDGSTVTTTNPAEPVNHTFHKSGTVKVIVYATVPGGSEIEAVSAECTKVVTYVAPQYACAALVGSIADDQKRKFRFTVKASTDKYTKLVSADFNLDTALTTGVTTKDSYGDIYQEYILDDGSTHKVIATVNFDTFEGKTSVNCETTVTPAKKPMCTIPGKEMLPPDSPQCVAPKVLAATTTLPKTGIGGVAGLVAVAMLGGIIFHKVSIRRKHQLKHRS